jgi:hypothetical protein
MFFKKKRSWQWLTLGALVFSGIIFAIARFFMHIIDKDAKKKDKNELKKKEAVRSDELFI